MMFRLRLKKFWPLFALLALCQGAAAQDASPWSEGHRSRVRLIAGAADASRQFAGVEVALDAGFKTYWRNPGESGLPPAFDWSKSVNADAIDVLWPAPTRAEDAGGVSFGYSDSVIFPVRVRPRDPAQPVTLVLTIEYGVCKDICIPARADLSLTLPKGTTPATQPLVKQALARVPRQQPLGAGRKLALLGAEPATVAGKAGLAVTVRAPAGSSPRLFVEAPDNWFLLPAADPTRVSGGSEARDTFQVAVLERPREASGPLDLRFTVVAGDEAIETSISLDAARLPR